MAYKDPEKQKAYKKAYSKAWYEANREKAIIMNRAWRAVNREKVNAYPRAYNANPLNSASHSIHQLTGLKKAEIPTELLEAQALIISIHREIRNHEKLHRA